jgi:hypothetical protein
MQACFVHPSVTPSPLNPHIPPAPYALPTIDVFTHVDTTRFTPTKIR